MPFNIGDFSLDIKDLQTRAKGGIVTDGLVLHLDAAYKNSYPLGGTTWYDLSGNGNHGTMTNGPTFAADNNGYINFDGTNDYVTIGNSMIDTGAGLTSGDSSYTLEAWIYIKSSQGTTTDSDSIIGNTSDYGVGMQVGISNGNPRINYGARSTSNFYSSEFGYNQWTHVVLSRIAGTSLIGYINGVQDTTFTATNLTIASTSWGNMTIGNSSARVSGYLDGYIASVRVYNKGLSPDEVWQNYENTKNRFTWEQGPSIITDGLALYLDAGDASSYPGTGTTWYDLSGNGNHGTLTNGPTYNSANGGSIVFDGSNDHMLLPSNFFSYPSLSTFSISLWFKSTQTNGGTIFSQQNTTNPSSASGWVPVIYLNSNGSIRIEPFWTNNVNNTLISSTGFNNNVWHNVVTTFNSGTNQLFINGNYITQRTNLTLTSYGSTYYYIIGAGFADARSLGTYYFNGNISNFIFYNKVLSSTEILRNYNATKWRFGL